MNIALNNRALTTVVLGVLAYLILRGRLRGPRTILSGLTFNGVPEKGPAIRIDGHE